jgi:hypothetical protein
MGFNFSGLVIGKCYKDKPSEFMSEVGQRLNLSNAEEIDYETASSNWKDEGICDVYFGDNGTILYLQNEVCMDPWPQENARTLSFICLEMSMFFHFTLCKNARIIRTLTEENGQKHYEYGDALLLESQHDYDTSSVIMHLIDDILAQPEGVDLSEKAYRYQMQG